MTTTEKKKKRMMGGTRTTEEVIDLIMKDDEEEEEEEVSVVYTTTPPTKKGISSSSSSSGSSGTNRNNAISVEHYCDDRDLHLGIMASLLFSKQNPTPTPTPTPTPKRRRFIDLSLDDDDDDDDDDLQLLLMAPPPSLSNKKRKPFLLLRGESSSSKSEIEIEIETETETETETSVVDLFMCEICVDPKPYSESFKIKGCTHFYCSQCMIKYVASKLQENISQIPCPVSHCKGVLEPEHCRSILPPEVFERWGNALCEVVILASHKFYCPYKDCSAMLIDDRATEERQLITITQSECPYCRRLFCAHCNVAWHSGIECAEFQKLNKDERERDDLLLMNLAKNKKWIRCPKCRFYVERSQGCLFMRCRCGYSFCYNCGAPLKNHYCSKCKH